MSNIETAATNKVSAQAEIHSRAQDARIDAPESMGRYIVIEGCEGAGKSTQSELLAEIIEGHYVREPGGTVVSELLRGIILDRTLEKSAQVDMFTFAAARCALAEIVIRPSLEEGIDVVSDRSWLSSAAYQLADGASLEEILTINKIAMKDLFRPDITIVLDGEPSVLLKRALKQSKSDGVDPDTFESKEIEFHTRVRDNYLILARAFGATVINANQSKEEIHEEIISVVLSKSTNK